MRFVPRLLTSVRTMLLLLTAAIVVSAIAGCLSSVSNEPTELDKTAASISDDELRQRLDDILEWTYRHRHLNVRDHAAWQVMHGVLAYGREFLVEVDGERVPAVDYLLQGGRMNGWNMEPGIVVNRETGQRGLRAILEAGSAVGQGHVDHWLAKLATCNLDPDEILHVDGETYRMRDFVAQAMWDVPRNVDREYSWTLIGLSTYLPTDYEWDASDGQRWNMEQLVRWEAQQDLATSACGGTHRLSGMAIALQHHLDSGGELEGGWKMADEKIQESIEIAKAYQNPDGSFSSNYFSRPGSTPDLGQQMGSSGHTLEFLAIALTDEQLREPWMKRAVLHLCDLFERTKTVDMECGQLYHAASGLVIYRERMFGPRSYATPLDEQPELVDAREPQRSEMQLGESDAS